MLAYVLVHVCVCECVCVCILGMCSDTPVCYESVFDCTLKITCRVLCVSNGLLLKSIHLLCLFCMANRMQHSDLAPALAPHRLSLLTLFDVF